MVEVVKVSMNPIRNRTVPIKPSSLMALAFGRIQIVVRAT